MVTKDAETADKSCPCTRRAEREHGSSKPHGRLLE